MTAKRRPTQSEAFATGYETALRYFRSSDADLSETGLARARRSWTLALEDSRAMAERNPAFRELVWGHEGMLSALRRIQAGEVSP